MTLITSQRRTFLQLATALRPHWRSDRSLPDRIRALLGADRRLGARDRRLQRELLYTTVRHLPWVEEPLEAEPERGAGIVAWLAGDTPDTHRYRSELTEGWPPLPDSLEAKGAILGEAPEALVPGWLRDECPAAFVPEELNALHRRAPLWIRMRKAGAPAVAALASELAPLEVEVWPSSILGTAAKIRGRGRGIWEGSLPDLTRSSPYRRGAFEVQDLGSQLILASQAIGPGGHWLDACAGAGGKTLQLADLLGAEGEVDAFDIRPAALKELARRAERAGARNLRILRQLPDDATYDGILVDAPCSGSGTWRRAPHLKWTLTHEELQQHASRQGELLAGATRLLAPGGRLIYATCSLCQRENEGVVRSHLTRHPELELLPASVAFGYPSGEGGFGLSIRPSIHDTDGFFVASMIRR